VDGVDEVLAAALDGAGAARPRAAETAQPQAAAPA
jgi:hypothetical protein